jgi:E3 ubiquitin-protein ligase HUWE1
MQQNIRGHFSQARRVIDLPTYVRNCSAIALRDMDLFINVTKNMCLIENPYSSPHIKLLAGIQPSDKAAVPAEIPTDMQVDNPQTSSICSIPNKSVEVVIHLLVNEVMNTAKSVNETPSASASDAVGDGIPEANDQASPPVDDQDRQQWVVVVGRILCPSTLSRRGMPNMLSARTAKGPKSLLLIALSLTFSLLEFTHFL